MVAHSKTAVSIVAVVVLLALLPSSSLAASWRHVGGDAAQTSSINTTTIPVHAGVLWSIDLNKYELPNFSLVCSGPSAHTFVTRRCVCCAVPLHHQWWQRTALCMSQMVCASCGL